MYVHDFESWLSKLKHARKLCVPSFLSPLLNFLPHHNPSNFSWLVD